ncbi:MAG: lytic murein transglycosylase [Gammaproteobacteria bacterium SHHR-1]|uniref:lytic murein transglycosylase n=1 Tax=Magnetovirga frankeli TaxID=947516 RepID=UPI0012936430|nr:lytic murein transglycosylase [gamma proteobacterium SS-5]
MENKYLAIAALILSLFIPVAPSLAADCGNGPGGFSAWLKRFKQSAQAEGISQKTLNSALGGVSYSALVIQRDRNQHSMKLSFEAFYKRRVSNAMIKQGRNWIASNKSLAERIEKRFGVPIEVPVSIWGMETHYGSFKGEMLPIFTSLATLAYDCRRSDFFRRNLLSALRIVQRGDMRPSQMRGAWAGEIGQTQFMAEAYYKYAVDFDGNGRRDLINSPADVLASTANYLKGYGWKRGGSWQPGSHNYGVLKEWNKAGVYVKAIAKMAQTMASGKPLGGGKSTSGQGRNSGSGNSSGYQFH